jgi:hypothetical protein
VKCVAKESELLLLMKSFLMSLMWPCILVFMCYWVLPM